MDYERLPVILKRYSFIEKMRVLQYYSKQIMNINGIELTSGQPMAWELETFLLFAVKADEYNDNDFKGKNINKFIEMINCIKEHQHPTLVNKIGTIEFADFLLIALGSTQFDIQTYNIYKYYRYNYFFTYDSYVIWTFQNRTKITILSAKPFENLFILISRVRAPHTHGRVRAHMYVRVSRAPRARAFSLI